jgi:hypothetical protein
MTPRGIPLSEIEGYVTLVCPTCGSDKLATIEDLAGTARCLVLLNPATGERMIESEGWTDVNWDVSVSLGITCLACSWRQDAALDGPALQELEPKAANGDIHRAYVKCLRDRGNDLAADRLELLDDDVVWENWLGPLADRLEELLG